MGHRIPNHKGKCSYPHGHHYRLEATFAGAICQTEGSSDEGMVCDFGDLKGLLKKYIYDKLDHRFVVYDKDTKFRKHFDSKTEKEFNLFIVDFIPTTENLLLWVSTRLQPRLPSKLTLKKLRLYESSNHWAEISF